MVVGKSFASLRDDVKVGDGVMVGVVM